MKNTWKRPGLFLGLLTLCLLGPATESLAQLTYYTGDALLNTTTAQAQRHPAVAVNTSGSYAVAWQSAQQDGSDWGHICPLLSP